ncbi:hypothetical protein FF1_032285 [Malus domestica]
MKLSPTFAFLSVSGNRHRTQSDTTRARGTWFCPLELFILIFTRSELTRFDCWDEILALRAWATGACRQQ